MSYDANSHAAANKEIANFVKVAQDCLREAKRLADLHGIPFTFVMDETSVTTDDDLYYSSCYEDDDWNNSSSC